MFSEKEEICADFHHLRICLKDMLGFLLHVVIIGHIKGEKLTFPQKSDYTSKLI